MATDPDLTSNRRVEIETGSWSTPAPLGILSTFETSRTSQFDLVWDGSSLRFLVAVSDDPSQPNELRVHRRKLSVYRKNGNTWELEGSIKGGTRFGRGAAISSGNGDLTVYYAGDPLAELPDLPYPAGVSIHDASMVYRCEWNNGACITQDSLRVTTRRTSVDFSKVATFEGKHHLFMLASPFMFHVVADDQSIQIPYNFPSSISASVVTTETGLLMSYGAPGIHYSGFDTYVRPFTQAGWGEQAAVFRNPDLSVQRTALFSDTPGEIHAAWWAGDARDPYHLWYARSDDGGVTWLDHEILFRHSLFHSRRPLIFRDRLGIINVIGGNLSSPRDWTQFRRGGGGWVKSEMFADEPKLDLLVATTDDMGNIHAIYDTDGEFYYSVYQ